MKGATPPPGKRGGTANPDLELDCHARDCWRERGQVKLGVEVNYHTHSQVQTMHALMNIRNSSYKHYHSDYYKNDVI